MFLKFYFMKNKYFCGSGSQKPKCCGDSPDPDPKLWFQVGNYFIPRPGYYPLNNVGSVELHEAEKGDWRATGDWKTDEGTRIWKHSLIIFSIYK